MKTTTHSALAGQSTCPSCKDEFPPKRRDQIYCRPACRKASFQKGDRKKNPKNSTSSLSKKRDNELFFDIALRLAEMFYTMPPRDRLGFINGLVDAARSGNTKLRHVLTNKVLLKPDLQRKRLFYRRCHLSYLTIAQIAVRFCRHFWSAGVKNVVTFKVPEPPTGEYQPS